MSSELTPNPEIHARIVCRRVRLTEHRHGQNDLAMAAALASLHVIEEDKLVENAAAMGPMVRPLAAKAWEFAREAAAA